MFSTFLPINYMNTNRGDFDVNNFNKKFEENKELTKARIIEAEKERLEKLNSETKQKKITELTIIEILIGTKDTIFDILDDLLQRQFTVETFTKNNRLFFIGVLILVVTVIIYLYDVFTTETITPKNEKIIKIYRVNNSDKSIDSNISNESNPTDNIYIYTPEE